MVRERLQMAWVIFATWLEREGFTVDEVLHLLGGLALALWCWWAPPLLVVFSVPLLLGYLREVAQAQAKGKPHPWNPLHWSDHRLREWAAWGLGTIPVLVGATW